MPTFTQQFTNDTDGFDTFLDSNATTSNYDGWNELYIGRSNANNFMYRGLVKFDFSTIPPNAVITSAVISLYSNGVDAAGSGTSLVDVFRILRDWVETQATWNIWKTSNNWSSAGALTNASDVDTTAIATSGAIHANLASGDEITFSLDVVEFTKFVNGTYSNYGFGFKQQSDTSLARMHQYCSSRHATSGYHPKLVVEYFTGDGEPVSMSPYWMFFKRYQRRLKRLLEQGAVPIGRRVLTPI